MSYQAKLRDPRWKALRATVLIRDGNTCTKCGAKNNLQIHHKRYTGEPWEAPINDLVTLCDECHEQIHKKSQPFRGRFFMIFADTLQQLLLQGEEASRTVLYMASKVKDENQVYVRQSELVKEMGVVRATVERHLLKAKELGLLVPDPREAGLSRGVRLWRLCPYLVWVGDREAQERYLAKLPKDHSFHQWSPQALASKQTD